MEILCFFAGTAFFYLKSKYPLYFIGILFFFRPKPIFVLWFFAAIIWSQFHQWLIAEQNMPKIELMTKATLQGYIVSLPIHSSTKTQFQFLIEQLDGKKVQATILLSCYKRCPDLHVGQHWQLLAKVKQPINLSNPGGFDYVGWLRSRHLNWVGNVYKGTFHRLQPTVKDYPLTQLREYLANRLNQLVPRHDILGVFEALTLGVTHHVSKTQWDLFRRTGTTHLIDISGEHIALIAGLSYWLFKGVWKNLGQLCLRYPAPKFASAGAILVSLTYALIAGFSVPTQRAFITCFMILLRHFISQRISVWQSWRYALLAVLLFEPHSVFMLGFYFSFIAVAILILIHQRINAKGVQNMMSLQLACLFGLMPLTLYWFSYGSMSGLIANLFAIPWVSFMIVPLALLIAFLSPWIVIPGSVFLLKGMISCLLFCLRFIDSFHLFHFNLTFTDALSPIVLMAAMALFTFLPLVRLFPTTLVLMIASVFPNYEKVKADTVTMDVLDVGQGLAIVIRTEKHVLIYDTGMKFYQGVDMGTLAIIPYLNTLGIKAIDKIIISHPDLDHRGGLQTLEKNYPIKELVVDHPSFYQRGASCHHYPSWQWDGVVFQFFPILKPLRGKNNHSCILKISNQYGQILLSGDIESSAEHYLINTYGHELAATIMLVPHHGSKTSSSRAYVNQVAPRFAIASYGFDNRYHFPHQKALDTYQKYNIPVYNTKDCGMVRVELNKFELIPTCYRQRD
jgi:competence protein ComEC